MTEQPIVTVYAWTNYQLNNSICRKLKSRLDHAERMVDRGIWQWPSSPYKAPVTYSEADLEKFRKQLADPSIENAPALKRRLERILAAA